MRIIAMTATFGKLEHKTLTLKPGLNIIEAPNEWGKSTWCAFLIAMLYGMDTRAKSTKTALADKERYLPWSGSPMAGRIDLNWNGRNITIERRTKGRTVLGEFRAYETETGLEVPELTAATCGQTLLGVEKNVFVRAGFIRFSDLPVTQDEALRRRLNALVTTGDESNAGDALAQKLKDLKNRCRYNRSGLLPQAETELTALEASRAELRSMKTQADRLQQRQAEVEQRLGQLENHKAALQYAAAQADAHRVEEARQASRDAAAQAEAARLVCAALPSRQETERAVAAIRDIHQQWQSLQMETEMLPQAPATPEIPAAFQGLSPDEALSQAQRDKEQAARLTSLQKKSNPVLWILTALLAIAGGVLMAILPPAGVALLCTAAVALTVATVLQIRHCRRRKQAAEALDALHQRYGTPESEDWLQAAQSYGQAQADYALAYARYQESRGNLDQRTARVREEITRLSCGTSLQEQLVTRLQILDAWDRWENAQRDLQRAQSHAVTAEAMAKSARPPQFPDTLDYTEEETARLISDAAYEHRQLQLQLGQCQGRMASLGEEAQLDGQITALRDRIRRLEETYAALELAQATLTEAATELQRRFAPKIAAKAQALFARLTDRRYDRLTLAEDLSLNAGTREEDTLRGAMWRSDGTVDQLYLALRLAVAEELTPEAPLVLDDALVRFDDTRLAAALGILREEGEHRQVLLFTCQGRENSL